MRNRRHRIPALALAVCMLAAMAVPAAASETLNPDPVIGPTPQSMQIDGEPVTPAAYNIDGFNYFKLRDLAALLTGTACEFNVIYREQTNEVELRTGVPYEPVGGELTPITGPRMVSVCRQTVTLDGEPIDLAAYNIDGNNYFWLAELGVVLGLTVEYDEEANLILVSTQDGQQTVQLLVLVTEGAAAMELPGDWSLEELQDYLDSVRWDLGDVGWYVENPDWYLEDPAVWIMEAPILSSLAAAAVDSEETAALETLEQINRIRAQNDLPPLTLDPELCRLAHLKAQDMADCHYFSHTSPNYGTAFEMLTAFGIPYEYSGENIAKGFVSASAVMAALMHSEGHRNNILSTHHTKLGVGYVAEGNVWVQLFTD